VRRSAENPFVLDSQRPRIPLKDYAYNELRYKMLTRTNPAEAERLMHLAEGNVRQVWDVYEEMATRGPSGFPSAKPAAG
jgi:pyruvate-ferredoxin/flavodoxin oxidoreductase